MADRIEQLEREDERKLHQKLGDAIKLKSVDVAAKAQITLADASAHVPLYAMTPGAELLHRVAAVLLAVALLVGLYAYEHPGETVGTVAGNAQASLAAQAASAGEVARDVWLGLDFGNSPEQAGITIVVSPGHAASGEVQ